MNPSGHDEKRLSMQIMKQKTAVTLGRPSLGRPREFDREAALQIAVKLFCKHGYEGVSIADLTQAMKISPPSLYAAFGDKESLFREALKYYQNRPDLPHIEASGPIRDKVRELLRDSVRAATGLGYPAGCMLAAGMINCGAEFESLAGTLTEIRNRRCKEIEAHLAQAVARRELPADADIPAIGRYISALIQGIAIQAKDGATPAELYALVDVAMQCWPGSPMPAKQPMEA
jgi:AcrR family transcriptional regulator